mmetsp:Transcript_12733/g.27909  ORF Transcript_12733/g.27909 Transcript_12733/m.27909 type:complete len:121 (+) Transcript_12733:539-901(+)
MTEYPDDFELASLKRTTSQRLNSTRRCHEKQTCPFCSTFCISGYAAGYYVYLWAQVLITTSMLRLKRLETFLIPKQRSFVGSSSTLLVMYGLRRSCSSLSGEERSLTSVHIGEQEFGVRD